MNYIKLRHRIGKSGLYWQIVIFIGKHCLKKSITLSAFTASMLASFAAQAADLSIKGVIRPTACTPSLANGGLVDYGTIDARQLSADEPTKIGKRTIPFSVNCSGSTAIALRLIDNRSGSAVQGMGHHLHALYGTGYNFSSDHKSYGLGTVNGQNIGAYFVRIDPSSVSGVQTVGGSSTYSSLLTNPANENWVPAGTMEGTYFTASGLADRKGFSLGTSSVPASWSSVSGKLNLYTMINKGSDLPLEQEINLDGSATLELMYL